MVAVRTAETEASKSKQAPRYGRVAPAFKRDYYPTRSRAFRYPCGRCGTLFLTRADYAAHLLTHQAVQVLCLWARRNRDAGCPFMGLA